MAHRTAISPGHLLLLLLLKKTKNMPRAAGWTNRHHGQTDTKLFLSPSYPPTDKKNPSLPSLWIRFTVHFFRLTRQLSPGRGSLASQQSMCATCSTAPFKPLLLIHQWPALPYCFTMAPADLTFSLSLSSIHSLGRHHSKTKHLSKP